MATLSLRPYDALILHDLLNLIETASPAASPAEAEARDAASMRIVVGAALALGLKHHELWAKVRGDTYCAHGNFILKNTTKCEYCGIELNELYKVSINHINHCRSLFHEMRKT